MVADLLRAPDPRLPHVLRLPTQEEAASAAEEVRQALATNPPRGELTLLASDWILPLPELRGLQDLVERHGLRLTAVRSERPETLVAAAALGLAAEAPVGAGAAADDKKEEPSRSPWRGGGELHLHRGTLRAGDHHQVEGSVLLLGDLNACARLSASGDILVWGRLRGVAHAGCGGDRGARIVALQLRPLQLRIADAVARGPDEAPAPGLAEQARLVNGEIHIEPAAPVWPAPAGRGRERSPDRP
ncbi:MAG: septum site-determining protein MinC [Cyanobium sp.]